MKSLLILVLLLLASCAHETTQLPAIPDAASYQKQLTSLQQWQADGKLAIQRANKSDSVALHWEQVKTHFDIFLSGPLGAGATRITGTPESLVLTDSDGEHSTTSDLQQLIAERLGWTFPVEQLPQWVLGVTDAPHAQFNADHTLAGFEQDGWQIYYSSYQIVGQRLLPEKILLQRDDLRVTLVIKHWDIR